MITASACGKIILFGEHAVVYGRPAIAVPVTQVQVTATIESAAPGITILSAKTGETLSIDSAPSDHPLVAIVRLTLQRLGLIDTHFTLTIDSTIPIASGLGSGAAVSTASVRALTQWTNIALDEAAINELVYEVEKLHHGTPSGIDNTVIVYQKPAYFIRGEPLQTFSVAKPFTVVIGNTGVASPTKIAVGDVRRGWETDRARYEAWFDRIGAIVQQARSAIETGAIDHLGPLLDQNQVLLRDLDVSSVELERLIFAAKQAGASGAKLVGGGRGGNMIALVNDRNVETVTDALKNAGAVSVMATEVR